MCAAEQERTRYKNEWERRTYFYGRVEEHIPHRPLKRVEENALSGVCVIRFFNHPERVSNFSRFLPARARPATDSKNEYFLCQLFKTTNIKNTPYFLYRLS
jgi:hypothetical protein